MSIIYTDSFRIICLVFVPNTLHFSGISNHYES